jgi:hypothetical protein
MIMGERQLRSRSLATVAEAVPQEPELCHDNRELASNSFEMETLNNHEGEVQVDVQIDCEVGQSCEIRVTNLMYQITILLCCQGK